MITRLTAIIGALVCLGVATARAQHTGGKRPPSGHAGQPAGAAHGAPAAAPAASAADPALKNAAERALGVVGRDRWRQAHRIEPRPDGGRIVIELDRDDPVAVLLVRTYVRELARQFSAGQHWLPGFGMPQPSADARAPALAGTGRAEARDLPRGAELIWTSQDPSAVGRIQQTLRRFSRP